MARKNSFCSFCGGGFQPQAIWPRTCEACGNTSFLNPLPVAVGIVPVDGGLLTIRRAIPPKIGELALPGGYIDFGEPWQNAVAREVREETGVLIDPTGIQERRVLSAPDGTVLIFGLAPPVRTEDLAVFRPTSETSELVVITEPVSLAFPLHETVVQEYFSGIWK